jgi:hypothetical protein
MKATALSQKFFLYVFSVIWSLGYSVEGGYSLNTYFFLRIFVTEQ